jgi:DNA-binding NarL/FixJ family response regulator
MTIQVILADDQPLVRAGLRRLLEQTPDIDVAGEAGTGAEAVQLTRDTGPDVVLMTSAWSRPATPSASTSTTTAT